MGLSVDHPCKEVVCFANHLFGRAFAADRSFDPPMPAGIAPIVCDGLHVPMLRVLVLESRFRLCPSHFEIQPRRAIAGPLGVCGPLQSRWIPACAGLGTGPSLADGYPTGWQSYLG